MMDFPAFVPAAVRAHIKDILEGEPIRQIPGYQGLLEEAERKLKAVSESLDRKIFNGEDSYVDGLRLQKAEAQSRRDRLAEDVKCLNRLGHDPRMRDVFSLLTSEFTEDEQWRSFIYAAWSARINFKEYRERLKEAVRLKEKIAEAAESLANLIHQFNEARVMGPSEFYSITELLRQTDNHQLNNHNLQMWRSMRGFILGDPPMEEANDIKPEAKKKNPVAKIKIEFISQDDKAPIDPEEKTRNMLRYAWGTAPDFSALLGTMARKARKFKPSESGMIGAAIKSRQSSPKTEYLRAFGNLLTDVHKFALSMPIMQAMATVGNVVINLPDVDATYDDVRKALAKLGGERLENSGEK